MTEMNCNDCLRLLHGYLDNELEPAKSMLVAEHLESCSSCRHEYREIQHLSSGVKAHAQYFEAPASLSSNVFAAVAAQSSDSEGTWQAMLEKARHWLAPAFSAAALAAASILYVAAPGSQDAWMDEAVSEHVRSLMAEHLNDVASSDRHTVKPWFTGKLDFSPPVYDFAAQGYPLLGGRLDYLQHQNTAALTYRRNKHIINVFIFPVQEESASSQTGSERGYNVIRWQQNHMRFIAVSDLNMQELKALTQLIQKEL
ncbi:MAG TPA: anti-sigma factor [Rickettsiales bacterium]|nr:anti-sigma factor [Rickettsiales bacterium]